MSMQDRCKRLEISSKHPVLYHGIVYTSYVHRAVVRGHIPNDERSQLFFHKGETLKHLRAELEDLSLNNVEYVIMALL